MAVKMIVDTLEGLDEPIAQLYSKGEDGKYRLGVDGIEDTTGLKKALAAEKAEREALKQKWDAHDQEVKAREAEAAKKAEELARKAGDVAAIEKSWSEKLTKREQELLSQVKAKEQAIESLTVDATASKLAAELFGDGAPVLEHNIRSRLRTEFVDGKPMVRVLDEAGQPSAMTIDELKKSFVDNKTYARFIVASKASGGGSGGANAGGGSGAGKVMTREAFEKLPMEQRFEFIKNRGKIRS